MRDAETNGHVDEKQVFSIPTLPKPTDTHKVADVLAETHVVGASVSDVSGLLERMASTGLLKNEKVRDAWEQVRASTQGSPVTSLTGLASDIASRVFENKDHVKPFVDRLIHGSQDVIFAPDENTIVVDKIGEGNFGIVYLAFDIRQRCNVAMKVSKFQSQDAYPNNGTSSNPMRINAIRNDREGRVLRDNKGGTVLPDYRGSGSVKVSPDSEEEHPYILMEFLRGHNLKTIREKMKATGMTMNPEKAVDLLVILLQKICDMNGIHRDIKPDNTHLNDDGTIRFEDVRFAIDNSGGARATTSQNGTIGSLRYAPPEQFGQGHKATKLSDAYSAAATVYEMVSGLEPSEGDDILEIGMWHRDGHTPDTSMIADQHPALAKALDALFSKDSGDRLRSGGNEDLQEHEIIEGLKQWIEFLRPHSKFRNNKSALSEDPKFLDITSDNQPLASDSVHTSSEVFELLAQQEVQEGQVAAAFSRNRLAMASALGVVIVLTIAGVLVKFNGKDGTLSKASKDPQGIKRPHQDIESTTAELVSENVPLHIAWEAGEGEERTDIEELHIMIDGVPYTITKEEMYRVFTDTKADGGKLRGFAFEVNAQDSKGPGTMHYGYSFDKGEVIVVGDDGTIIGLDSAGEVVQQWENDQEPDKGFHDWADPLRKSNVGFRSRSTLPDGLRDQFETPADVDKGIRSHFVELSKSIGNSVRK
ncbi:MAG: protein kinase [Candidatus Peribacteraceae bacterium]|nr:protein kinase [Candidatus Peribacteraceae bacterium]